MAETAAAAAIAGGAVFDYNRQNFLYDRQQRLKLELQMFDFKIKKQDLYREDITDVCELTSVKMDTYLIVNAIQIGFCIIAICEGRMQPGTPGWLVGAHLLSMVCAFSFLLLSVWFAMHALIAARAYQTRLLTQLVRLPIPSWGQLEGSRTYGSYYEKLEARQMFRVPFLCGAQENIDSGGCLPSFGGHKPAADPSGQNTCETSKNAASDAIGFSDGTPAKEDGVDLAADPWGLERVGDTIYELNSSYQSDPRKLRHIQLVREAMQYWQGSDAFARVSMSVGTSQFAIALAYYVLGYVLVYNKCIVGAWLAVILFVACAWALLRIDMSLDKHEYVIGTILQVVPPIGMAVCITFWALDMAPIVIQIFLPVIYLLHAAWMMYLACLCKVVEQKNGAMVPTGFKAVLYIDIFGWIKRGVSAISTMPSKFREKGHMLDDPDAHGMGPALNGIRYVDGKPVPVRPDQFSCATHEPDASDVKKSDLSPDTFVPPHEENGAEGVVGRGYFGGKPWHTFLMLKRLFSAIWILSGIIVAWELWGDSAVQVAPLLRQTPATLLQFEQQPLSSLIGSPVETAWPHENVQPIALSCDSTRRMMIASSRHKIYAADLNGSAALDHIAFSSSPACEEVEGDIIQDATLQCSLGDSRSSCRALVMHQKGRRLTSCPLKKSTTGAATSTSLGGTWLRGHDSKDEMKETVEAFAMPLDVSAASNEDQSVYITTSMQRLVKMQRVVGEDGPSWFPRRLLGKSPAVPRGGMDILSNRFLVFLSGNGHRIEARDLQNGGLSVGSWRLPGADKNWIPDGKSWTAMCATGDELYLLSEGSSPSIWRFPLPHQLRSPGKESESSHLK